MARMIIVECCGECPYFMDEYCGNPAYCGYTDSDINDEELINIDCPLQIIKTLRNINGKKIL